MGEMRRKEGGIGYMNVERIVHVVKIIRRCVVSFSFCQMSSKIPKLNCSVVVN